MIPHDDLAAVTEAELTERATAAAFESKTLEYKRELPGEKTSDKIKFLAGVSSLANTAGGDLVIGVDAPQEVPTAIPGWQSRIRIARLASRICFGMVFSPGFHGDMFPGEGGS